MILGYFRNYVVSNQKSLCQIITYGKLITKNVKSLITEAVNFSLIANAKEDQESPLATYMYF